MEGCKDSRTQSVYCKATDSEDWAQGEGLVRAARLPKRIFLPSVGCTWPSIP
jgi:hypothetical protein